MPVGQRFMAWELELTVERSKFELGMAELAPVSQARWDGPQCGSLKPDLLEPQHASLGMGLTDRKEGLVNVAQNPELDSENCPV